MHRIQPLAMRRCPKANIFSTAEVDSVEPHFVPQYKDPNLSHVGSEVQKVGGILEDH